MSMMWERRMLREQMSEWIYLGKYCHIWKISFLYMGTIDCCRFCQCIDQRQTLQVLSSPTGKANWPPKSFLGSLICLVTCSRRCRPFRYYRKNTDFVGHILITCNNIHTVDPVTNDLASARQKKSLVAESRWSQEWVFAVKIASAAPGSMSPGSMSG